MAYSHHALLIISLSKPNVQQKMLNEHQKLLNVQQNYAEPIPKYAERSAK